eukprot:g1998.t1
MHLHHQGGLAKKGLFKAPVSVEESYSQYVFIVREHVYSIRNTYLTQMVHSMAKTHRASFTRSSLSPRSDGELKREEKSGSNEADRSKFRHPRVLMQMDRAEASQRRLFAAFKNWLVINGAKFPDLYFKCYSKDVRGVHTKRSVPPYQEIMSIPLKCIITDETGRQTPIGRRLESVAHQLTVPNHCQVIVYMMMAMRRKDSFFQPYFDTLPQSFANFPIFWSAKEIEGLEGSNLVEQIYERKRNIRSDYDTICGVLPEFKEFSFENFLWCRTAVGSRNFSIVVQGKKRTAMVPMADMLNHFRPREASWTFDNAQMSFTMTSLKTIGRGLQVMDSYGKKCNSKFLLHYGFTIECNREADGTCQNEVEITLSQDPSSSAYERRCYFASKSRRFRITMNYEDRGTADALGFMRVAVATETELQSISHGLHHDVISLRNECDALRMLAQFAARKLAKYPTTLSEDERKLSELDMDPFGNTKHTLIVLRGEKQILHFYDRVATEFASIAALPRAARASLVRARHKNRSDLSRFITSIDAALTRRGL